MRIGLVSPYSWTYPGGVTGHIEALSAELPPERPRLSGARALRPADRLSARLHRGARPQERELPDWLVPLGRTFGFPANGAVSNLAMTPAAVSRLRPSSRSAATTSCTSTSRTRRSSCWDALMSADVPLVGTFHCYSANRLTNNAGNVAGAWRRLNRLRVRIAVSEAAAWTGRRFYGGRYRVIPNGVRVERLAPRRRALPRRPAAARVRRPGGRAQGPAGAAARLRGAARAPAGAAGRSSARRMTRSTACCSTTAACARSARWPTSASASALREARHPVRALARRRVASAWC